MRVRARALCQLPAGACLNVNDAAAAAGEGRSPRRRPTHARPPGGGGRESARGLRHARGLWGLDLERYQPAGTARRSRRGRLPPVSLDGAANLVAAAPRTKARSLGTAARPRLDRRRASSRKPCIGTDDGRAGRDEARRFVVQTREAGTCSASRTDGQYGGAGDGGGAPM